MYIYIYYLMKYINSNCYFFLFKIYIYILNYTSFKIHLIFLFFFFLKKKKKKKKVLLTTKLSIIKKKHYFIMEIR